MVTYACYVIDQFDNDEPIYVLNDDLPSFFISVSTNSTDDAEDDNIWPVISGSSSLSLVTTTGTEGKASLI